MARAARWIAVGCFLSVLACNQSVGGFVVDASDGTGPRSGPTPPLLPDAGGLVDLARPHPDAAIQCSTTEVFDGAPLATPANTWTWVDFPESRCRDGSTTGIGVRIDPSSDKLVIYLEGGGACFHDASCQLNALFSSFNQNSFQTWKSLTANGGIFDSTRADNPYRGWSAVYVPYCTGDVHAGNASHVDVPGANAPKNQYFVGYANIGQYLKRLVPTFPKPAHVVLTGVSAGGVGAAYNYDRVAQAFCPSRVTLVDDSGPPMSDRYLAPCLQQRWRDLWNLNATLPADCVTCRGYDGGGIINYIYYLVQKYPNSRLGLISSTQDGVISTFYGYGTNDCAGLTGTSAGMSGATFQMGLTELRDVYMKPYPQWATYFVASTQHTWTTPLSFYSTQVGGVSLTSWVDQLVNQGIANHVAP
jgi:hypothetical protein